MKNCHFIFLFLLFLVASCKFGKLPSRDLSNSNIKSVWLITPKGSALKSIRLDSAHIEIFAKILKNREEGFFVPRNCYTIHIELKDGGMVSYLTDGVKFKGFDDSSDLPFSFRTAVNVLKIAFNLQNLDSCNSQ